MESLSVCYSCTGRFVSEILLVCCAHSFYFRYNQLVCKYQTETLSMKYSICFKDLIQIVFFISCYHISLNGVPQGSLSNTLILSHTMDSSRWFKDPMHTGEIDHQSANSSPVPYNFISGIPTKIARELVNVCDDPS